MQNSWTISKPIKDKFVHKYYCTCTNSFKIKTSLDDEEAPDVLCPLCGNDYFKDAEEFNSITGTRIWKYFDWEDVVYEDAEYWKVTLRYKTPIYSSTQSVEFQDMTLLKASLKKDGSSGMEITSKSDCFHKYSLFRNDKVQPFKDILTKQAQSLIIGYILSKKEAYKHLMNVRNLLKSSVHSTVGSNLNKEKNDGIFLREQMKYVQDIQMLYSIIDQKREKIIKRTLFEEYQNSLEAIREYSNSDFIFSKVLENVDLFVKILRLNPEVKQNLFQVVKVSIVIDFIDFLKRFYTEKQIVSLFMKFNNKSFYQNNLSNLRDILRLVDSHEGFEPMYQNFSKVKLSINNLHNETIRVYNLAKFEFEQQENFEYLDKHKDTTGKYGGLDFLLPKTVHELHLWAQKLNNCMSGYANSIKRGQSVIYGVFRENVLCYAVELKREKVVQALGRFNNKIEDDDMQVIKDWHNNYYV